MESIGLHHMVCCGGNGLVINDQLIQNIPLDREEAIRTYEKASALGYGVLAMLDDSIDVYIQSAKVWVKETGIVYEKAFRLLDQNEEYTFKGQTIKTHQGIFELKDNVLSVKSTNQASAIDEYAAIEVTTTVKAQEEGIKRL